MANRHFWIGLIILALLFIGRLIEDISGMFMFFFLALWATAWVLGSWAQKVHFFELIRAIIDKEDSKDMKGGKN